MKPFLKWAGGKRQLLPEIRRQIPHSMDCYFEPFVGAGAVFLDFAPEKARINDSNHDLIETYRAIQSCPDELMDELRKHRENHSKEYFYQIRSLDRDDGFQNLALPQRAARIIYLNKTCFNGLYRVNSKGFFNVPYGRYKNPNICEEDEIKAISAYLNRNEIAITCGDFEQGVVGATENSLVYFDPPYHCDCGDNFTAYQAGGFGQAEHERLFSLFVSLSQQGVRCLLSNSDTPFVRDLYAAFVLETVQAPRMINRNPNGRGKVNELLIRNYSLV